MSKCVGVSACVSFKNMRSSTGLLLVPGDLVDVYIALVIVRSIQPIFYNLLILIIVAYEKKYFLA